MRWKTVGLGIGAAAVIAGTGFGVIKAGIPKYFLPSYEVLRVIDGDSFVTKEQQMIRVGNIDAPEYNNCGGSEAKDELEKLIVGKKLYLKVMFKDPFQRYVSEVFTTEGSVNEKMMKSGYVLYVKKYDEGSENLVEINKEVRAAKIGIYSDKCTQMTNPSNPKCSIKGNILDGKKYYRYPGCGQYGNTIVQLYFGDQWFCSEKEAKASGFTKGGDCK